MVRSAGTVRVGSLVEAGLLEVGDGYRMRNEELGPAGIPFVRGGDINGGSVDHRVTDHIRPEFGAQVARKLTRPWDVAFITKGNVGRVGLVRPEQPSMVFAPQIAYWRSLDHSQLDPRFLFYLLQGPAFQASLDGVKTHGAMVADYVSISQQHDFDVHIPSITRQRDIGRILGALDDKIELNRRMNETLEAMARALFKSWFVDFDPVRAKAEGRPPPGMDAETAKLFPGRFADSDLGPVPDGWEVGDIGSVADCRRDTVHPRNIDPRHTYVGLEHLPRGRVFLGAAGVAAGLESQKTRFLAGDTLFGKLRPYFKKVAIAPCEGICSTDILVLSPRDESHAFVTLLAASDPLLDHAASLSHGTRMPRTSWEQLRRFRAAIPPAKILHEFERRCAGLFRRAVAAQAESQAAAQLRDELLPRLLSGEISLI